MLAIILFLCLHIHVFPHVICLCIQLISQALLLFPSAICRHINTKGECYPISVHKTGTSFAIKIPFMIAIVNLTPADVFTGLFLDLIDDYLVHSLLCYYKPHYLLKLLFASLIAQIPLTFFFWICSGIREPKGVQKVGLTSLTLGNS